MEKPAFYLFFQVIQAVFNTPGHRIITGHPHKPAEYRRIPDPVIGEQNHFGMQHGHDQDIQEGLVIGNEHGGF